MKEHTDIGHHIINYLFSEEKELKDPVLIEWLDKSESNKRVFDQYEKIWSESGHYVNASAFDPDAAWEQIHEINRKKQKTGRRLHHLYYVISGVAASALILFALSFTGIFEKSTEVSVEMKAEHGSRSDITLPDGSTVKLNSGSNIIYSYNRKKKIREVTFMGEGFFKVAKNDIPFVVKLENGPEIRVLGTSFNLQAYPEDQIIQTSLLQGCVELVYGNEKLMMKSGDIAAFDKETDHLRLMDGTLAHAYGWIENKLYMNDMSLTDVCRYLERWYNVKIVLPAELGENIHYNGVIQEETISDVMDALSRLSNIGYHVKGKNINITSK